jgi:hypothetical protein
MHGSHVFPVPRLALATVSICLALLQSSVAVADIQDEESSSKNQETPLAVRIDANRTTEVSLNVRIVGKLITPATSGNQQWTLKSSGDFEFAQRSIPNDLSGPLAIQAVRQYAKAATQTDVGKDHNTQSILPRALSLIHVKGGDTGLHLAPSSNALTRRQYDLLQMPCDPLLCSGLMPSRKVAPGDKWNCDDWVLPRLTGLEAVTEQSLTCELTDDNATLASIRFDGEARGAVVGSAGSVELTGTLTLNKKLQFITQLSCQIKEKRSAGPVSPGLDAQIDVTWTQKIADASRLPQELNDSLFEKPFVLVTPWRLQLSHSDEWHLFNQTDTVIMLRQVRNGALISQCNISPGVVMPPGQHTTDADFTADVARAIQSGNGTIADESTIRDDKQWRVRRISTVGSVSDVAIHQDYYLCTAGSGEQFSLMFSHSAADSDEFGKEPARWLNSLQLASRRPALPFQ